jgi:hypothetical protein
MSPRLEAALADRYRLEREGRRLYTSPRILNDRRLR